MTPNPPASPKAIEQKKDKKKVEYLEILNILPSTMP